MAGTIIKDYDKLLIIGFDELATVLSGYTKEGITFLIACHHHLCCGKPDAGMVHGFTVVHIRLCDVYVDGHALF